MNLFDIQSGAALAHAVDSDRGTARQQIYYRITVLYADLLNSYARHWPKEETDTKLRLAARQYTFHVWTRILELYLRALINHGTIWSDKLIYSTLNTERFGTKVEGVIGVMSLHMMGGLHSSNECIKMINYHLWLKERLNIQTPTT